MKTCTLLTWQLENRLLKDLWLVLEKLLRCVSWMNNSRIRIHGKKIARGDSISKTRVLWLLWPSIQSTGKDIGTSSELFTRRAGIVISEAGFTAMSRDRHDHREPSHPFGIWIKDQINRYFEFLIHARGLLVRGLEPRLRKSLVACSET